MPVPVAESMAVVKTVSAGVCRHGVPRNKSVKYSANLSRKQYCKMRCNGGQFANYHKKSCSEQAAAAACLSAGYIQAKLQNTGDRKGFLKLCFMAKRQTPCGIHAARAAA